MKSLRLETLPEFEEEFQYPFSEILDLLPPPEPNEVETLKSGEICDRLVSISKAVRTPVENWIMMNEDDLKRFIHVFSLKMGMPQTHALYYRHGDKVYRELKKRIKPTPTQGLYGKAYGELEDVFTKRHVIKVFLKHNINPRYSHINRWLTQLKNSGKITNVKGKGYLKY